MSTTTKKTANEKAVVTDSKATGTIVATADSNIEDYNASLDEISGIPEENIEKISIPPKQLIAESETTCCNIGLDREQLEKAGMAPGTGAHIEQLAGALRYAISKLEAVVAMKNEWRNESPGAIELHDYLRHHLLFAYADSPEKLQRVREMSEGNSIVDKVQHLQNYSTFGRENPEELKRTGFDPALLDKAAALSARMGMLLGQKNVRDQNLATAELIHNRIYTCLKREIAKVRGYGKFIFYRDPKKRKLYTSGYYRKRNHKAEKSSDPADMSTAA